MVRLGWCELCAIVIGASVSVPLQAKTQSDSCAWLTGEYQIMWPNAEPQPMRISVKDAQDVQVEMAVAPDVWITQPLESMRNQDGMLPPCAPMVIDYGLFSTTRQLSWFLNENPGEAWVFVTEGKPIPVRKLTGVGAYQAQKAEH